MKSRLIAIVAAAILAGGAWASGHGDDVAGLIAEAKAERDKARALEFEWRYTSKHIAEAEKALAAGDPAKAAELAEKALFEAKTAQEQYETSEKVWMLAVPR